MYRLETIADNELIVVMDQGCVKEAAHPFDLLNDANSAFSALVRESGVENQQMFFKVAGKNKLNNAQNCNSEYSCLNF
jgi:hypothetical protein